MLRDRLRHCVKKIDGVWTNQRYCSVRAWTAGHPIGTIACTYFLYVLWSKQASTVLSLDYKKIIADTPHVRYGASLVANLVAAAVIITIIAACAFVL